MRMKFNSVLCVIGVIFLNVTGFLCVSVLDVCGKAPLNTRVVGGANARAGAWPWQASIYIQIGNEYNFCGGTLINKDWVLSAAHCFKGTFPSGITIQLGRKSQKGSNPNEISRTVSEVINHVNFNEVSLDNDITLLKLSSSVTFTNYIRPVCLAAAGSTFPGGTQSWITGWGRLSQDDAQISDILQEVKMPVVNNSVCYKAYTAITKITDNMICVGLLNQGGKGPCMGDSGGPMVSKQGSRWIQSGITSFSVNCTDPKYPAVYAKVSQYQNWINSQISSDQPGFVLFNSTGSSSNRQSINHLSFSLSLTFSFIPIIFSIHLAS